MWRRQSCTPFNLISRLAVLKVSLAIDNRLREIVNWGTNFNQLKDVSMAVLKGFAQNPVDTRFCTGSRSNSTSKFNLHVSAVYYFAAL
jgi:hypothetical protein